MAITALEPLDELSDGIGLVAGRRKTGSKNVGHGIGERACV